MPASGAYRGYGAEILILSVLQFIRLGKNMTYRRLHATLVALAMCLALTGCMGGDSSDGKRGRTAQRSRLNVGRGKKADRAKANRRRGAGNIDDFSPEGSMERDLAQLRQREKAQ